jgi:hypothetical protein
MPKGNALEVLIRKKKRHFLLHHFLQYNYLISCALSSPYKKIELLVIVSCILFSKYCGTSVNE